MKNNEHYGRTKFNKLEERVARLYPPVRRGKVSVNISELTKALGEDYVRHTVHMQWSKGRAMPQYFAERIEKLLEERDAI